MARTGENPASDGAIGASPRKEVRKSVRLAEACEIIPCNATSSNYTFEFSVKSPDLTVCTSSPDIPCEQIQQTPDYIRRGTQRNRIAPVELFSEGGCDSISPELGLVATPPESSPETQSWIRNDNLEASLKFEVIPEAGDYLLSINAGGIDDSVVCGSTNFQKDDFYTGGEIIRTDAPVGDGKGLALYQSARLGNFLYKFPNLEAGDYLVDLHLAEIIFTDGPPGMRVFDVYIQEEKVVSSIDIYAQVGSNQPLVLSDLRASIVGKEGLSLRCEGVVGSPIVCGISVRRDSSAGKRFQGQFAGCLVPISGKEREMQNVGKDHCDDCRKLKEGYELLLKEQVECEGALKDLKKENEIKSRECRKAWMSLQELQMELMRKSMHVGSLAFAVEGQVKEKSRWFQSLADLSEKFNMLKLEHAKVSEEALALKQCLGDITHMTATVQSTVGHYVNMEREHQDLKLKFIEESKERKDLYNKVIELKGNIRVFCRCRPLNAEEIAGGVSMAVDFESAKDGELTVKGHVSSKKVFKFDAVFSPEDDQEKVFEKTAPFATSVLDGYNVCIFAYGQTGTGKTFTMEGIEQARGVNYRTLQEIFRIIKEREGLFRYEISVSVLEVYNEQIHDLLLSGSQPGVAAKRLEVRELAEGVHHVPGLVEAHVSNTSEVWEVLQTGNKARAVGSTSANEHSSRSHCIHCVMVRGENLVTGECTRSKLWLIDLAGSERVAKTDAQGERLKEAQSINKSLSALGDVISSLATKSPHIPFRNSKLTHLLQDSLGGDSKTLMFVQISPNEDDVGETLCSLNFASRVRGIELGPAKKQVDVSEVVRYRQMVERAKQDRKNKDGQIQKMEENIHSLEMKNKAKDIINKNLQDKVKELESQLLIERKLARQHVDTKIAEHQLQQQQLKQQEPNIEPTNPRLVIQPLSAKISSATEHLAALTELGNLPRRLYDNSSSYKPAAPLFPRTDDKIFRHYCPMPKDKENKPELAEETLPRKASRVSLCPTTRRLPVLPAPRRYSLAPLPAVKEAAAVAAPAHLSVLSNNVGNMSPPSSSPLLLINGSNGACESESCSQPRSNGACESESRSHQPRSNKKINSILRRSLQKKVIIRSQLPQASRRGGALAGLEKLRGSIGGSGRKARRVLLSNATAGDRCTPQKQQHREKERGWNHGTVARNVF